MNRLFACMVLALLAVTPALAQTDAAWSAYVYNQSQQTLVRVWTDGTHTSYRLGLGDGVALQGRHMAFWPEGDRVAFCAVHYGKTASSVLIIRDLLSGEDRLSLPFEQATDCRVTQASLSDDQRQLAVALFHHFPGDPNADSSQPAWQYVVIDTTTGATRFTLNANDPQVGAVGIAPDRATIPEAFAFSGDRLTFYAIPYAVGGSTFYPTYEWSLGAGTLALTDGLTAYNLARLPRLDEQVDAAQDTALPFGIPNGPVPSNNVLRARRGEDAPQLVYHTPDWIIVDVDYIENGQRLAVTLYPPADEPQTSAFAVSLRAVALGRDGRVEALLATDGNMQIAGAPGGYVALLGSRDPVGPHRLFYASGGQMEPIWQSAGEAWELVWTAPVVTPEALPPFTSIEPRAIASR